MKNNPRKPFFGKDKSEKREESQDRPKKFKSGKSDFQSSDKRFDKKGSKPRFKKDFNEGGPSDNRKSPSKRFFNKEEESPKRERNERDSNPGTKRTYVGRGKDQKPMYGEKAPEKGNRSSAKRGFGKNRPNRIQNQEVSRPEYDFQDIPQAKNKKSGAELIRLNKYIANSGICSRREADHLIQNGQITVNGEVIKEMGYKVKRDDRVVYNGKRINPEKPVYILLNKPKDFITTTEDPLERKTVMNLVENACEERIFPIGRLDRNTTGLLLFTNDGELAAKLSHPSNKIKKIYQVTLDKPLTKNDEEAIREGLTLEDGLAEVDDLQVLSVDRRILGLEIHIGKNRIVRRIFAHLGYDVTALDRVLYAGLDKKDLKRGNYRFLSEKEAVKLKFFL